MRSTCSTNRGFTLLELLLVMGLIGTLMGLGLGMLGSGNTDMELSWVIIGDEVRTAHETARSTGRPTEVWFEQQDEGPMMVRSRVVFPVGHWHLEPDEDWFGNLVPNLAGLPVASGRYGHGMRPDLEEGKTMFSLPTEGRGRFDLAHGFSIRVELRMDRRERATVVELGEAFKLELDQDLRPVGHVTLAAPGPRPGQRLKVEARQPLALLTWTQLELTHDGRRLTLAVEGVELSSVPARGEVYQQKSDVLTVSPGDTPVHGVLDEIRLLAYEVSAPKALPFEATLVGFQGPVAYDGRGQLRAPAKIGSTIEIVLGGEREKRSLAPGGVLK